MLIYKNEIPKEYSEILDEIKVPYIDGFTESDVVGICGDNLQSMIALEPFYSNRIQLIYADVPYNTGNELFLYNDKKIDKDSKNYHSSWISWMLPRLRCAKKLLSASGFLVLSIDHNERRNLENLCISVFGENNVLEMATVVSNRGGGGRRNTNNLVTTNEYLIICCKDRDNLNFGMGVLNRNKKGETKPRSLNAYNGKLITDRPTMFYPFLVSKNDNKVTTITTEEFLKFSNKIKEIVKDYIGKNRKKYDDLLHSKISEIVSEINKQYSNEYHVIFPISDGKWGRWTKSHENSFLKKGDMSTVFWNGKKINIMEEVKDFTPMKTILDSPDYSNSNATQSLKDLYGSKTFDTPKSPILMRDIITQFSGDGDFVMDFCAGSNSTYHGLCLADELQEFNRKYIYLQNDESNIFRDHSEERINTINNVMSINKTHSTNFVKLIDVENFILDDTILFDKENFLLDVFRENKSYKNMVKRFDRLYEAY
jgi:adenine-specific DNA-methyltransferase